MTWHLKDRELEKKLIAIDPKFVSRLDRVTKDAFEFEGKGFLVAGVEAVEVWYKDEVLFALDFSITELKEVEEYNPNDWNAYPEITPPEGILMRVETDRFRDCAIFKDGYWYSELFGEPNGRFQAEVECFRPWSED